MDSRILWSGYWEKRQDHILRNNKITMKVRPEFSNFLKYPDGFRYFKFLSVLVLEIKDRNHHPLHRTLKQKKKDFIMEEKYKNGLPRLISILKHYEILKDLHRYFIIDLDRNIFLVLQASSFKSPNFLNNLCYKWSINVNLLMVGDLL